MPTERERPAPLVLGESRRPDRKTWGPRNRGTLLHRVPVKIRSSPYVLAKRGLCPHAAYYGPQSLAHPMQMWTPGRGKSAITRRADSKPGPSRAPPAG